LEATESTKATASTPAPTPVLASGVCSALWLFFSYQAEFDFGVADGFPIGFRHYRSGNGNTALYDEGEGHRVDTFAEFDFHRADFFVIRRADVDNVDTFLEAFEEEFSFWVILYVAGITWQVAVPTASEIKVSEATASTTPAIAGVSATPAATTTATITTATTTAVATATTTAVTTTTTKGEAHAAGFA
jgi:hypothetical protein